MGTAGEHIVAAVESTGMVAIIRADAGADLLGAVRALVDGGCRCLEISLNTPGALEGIAAARKALGAGAYVGAGTVLDAATAANCLSAGAQFIVAPVLDIPTIQFCKRNGVPIMPGAMIPTEILRAWEAGADVVKVFPNLLGPRFIREVRTPLPQVKLMPTGGIDATNVADYIAAGAVAVGIGGGVVARQQINNRDFAAITQATATLLDAIRTARQNIAP